jgi:hypothetical protein
MVHRIGRNQSGSESAPADPHPAENSAEPIPVAGFSRDRSDQPIPAETIYFLKILKNI